MVACNEIKNQKSKVWRFEVCVGAILTQSTAWKNVEKAIKNLAELNLLTPEAILKCSKVKLEKCIKPAGYFRQKAKKLKIFSSFLVNQYHGDLNKMFICKLSVIRYELLSVWGIGPETADSILLYAGDKSSFVIDTYTKRLCALLKIQFKDYNKYKQFFENNLPHKPELFNEYHALIVAWGKLYNQNKEEAIKILKK